MDFKKRLSERMFKQHCLGSRIAIAVNILWGISNYFIIDENKWIYVGINMAVAAVIFTAMVFKERLRLTGESLGLVPMLATITAFAYTYNTIDLESFRHMTYTHMAVFIGAGMFLIWRMKYTLISIGYALAINIVFFQFSELTFQEYMSNGAIAVVTVMIFMIISIQTRYVLEVKNILATTALQKSKNRLEVSEKQHRLLFEQNPTAMMICSLETLKILAVNDAIIQKYGYPREEFVGMDVRNLHKDVDLADLILCIENPEEDLGVKEWVHVLKDKSEINVEMITKTLDYKNEPARLISINDITETVKHQNHLEEAKKFAEESKELQSQFLSNMSHEIRTPMNGIMGITRILQNSDMSPEQMNYLEAIIKSSENLMVIINDILDFSKIEAGKIVLERNEFDLKKMIDVTHEVLAVTAEAKKVYLSVHIDDDVPQFVIGDTVRLSQIITNLVSNGIKFTERGGVTIKVETAGKKDGKTNIRFSIRDTGIGIPEDKIETIFESFTQASSSTTRKHGGTGLGLTISRQLTELQDGKIWVESTEGKGSTFFVEIPYEVVDASNAVDETQLKLVNEETMLPTLGASKVLLVEDHPINQMLAMKVLKDWNIDVALAENGLIALDMVAKDDYDLILMDISMPEMDGYTATKEIRSGKHTADKDIPIVAMTASALIGENQKCFKAGMNDYITKPFEPANLMEKIYNNLRVNHLKSA